MRDNVALERDASWNYHFKISTSRFMFATQGDDGASLRFQFGTGSGT